MKAVQQTFYKLYLNNDLFAPISCTDEINSSLI